MRPSSVKAMAFAFLLVFSAAIALPPAAHAARNQTAEPRMARERGDEVVRTMKRLLRRLFGIGNIVSDEHPVVPHP